MTRFLNFLSLLNDDGTLSITNIAVIIAIAKMGLTASFSGMDACGLIGALANMAHARHVDSKL